MISPRSAGRASNVVSFCAWLAISSALAPGIAASQEPGPAANGSPGDSTARPLVVTAGYAPDVWQVSTAALELVLSRPLGPQDPPLAIWIGSTDVTGAFQIEGDRLRCGPPAPPLPSGSSEIVVYAATDSTPWPEVGRFPIRILTAGGFETAQSTALLQGNEAGQLALESHPEDPGPVRKTFQDAQVTTGWNTTTERSGWVVSTRASFTGVSNKTQALRFSQRGEAAPAVDLSDYQVRVQHGSAALAFGQVQQGAGEYVLDDRSGRGIQLQWSHGSVLTWSGVLMSGTTIVGWEDPVGLRRTNDRILASTVGLELAPRRPGLAQVSASVTDASIQPQPGFNQGVVNDAERSRGFSLRLHSNPFGDRVDMTGVWARSRFENTADPLLAQGATLVAVKPLTRGAGYFDTSLKPLRGTGGGPQVTVHYRFERVDPLFRSATGSAAADRRSHIAELSTVWKAISVGGSYGADENNLDHIPSLLTTRTRRTGVRLGAPLAQFIGAQRLKPLFPVLSGTLNYTHQYGLAAPSDGGFRTSAQVPDQMIASYQASGSWQVGSTQLTYSHQHSSVDNRQIGREFSDFRSTARQARIDTPVGRHLTVSMDGSLERQESLERHGTNSTLRTGGNLGWQPLTGTQVVAFLSTSRQSDDPRTSENRQTEFRLELNQQVNLLRLGGKRAPIQMVLRYARQRSESKFGDGPEDVHLVWSVNSGFTVGLS